MTCSNRSFDSQQLIVSLRLDAPGEVEKILLSTQTSKGGDTLYKYQIGTQQTVRLQCPQKGEGTVQICVFTKQDTICSDQLYVEPGYRPLLKMEGKQLKVLRNF
ncbi:MAG: hypothetical protein OHK0053_28990 [Microscillaceae bacterium]